MLKLYEVKIAAWDPTSVRGSAQRPLMCNTRLCINREEALPKLIVHNTCILYCTHFDIYLTFRAQSGQQLQYVEVFVFLAIPKCKVSSCL